MQSQRASREQKIKTERAATATDLRRKSLLMQRARILQEIQKTSHPRFLGQLKSALAHLDAELARMDSDIL